MNNIQDLLPFYALDALTDDERAEVDAWLLEHPEARVELDDMLSITDHLVESTEPIVPPPAIKSALMTRIGSDARAVAPVKTPAPVKSTQPTLWERLLGLYTQPAFVSIAFSLLALATGYILILHNDIQQLRVENAGQQVEIAKQELLVLAGEVNASQAESQLEALNADVASRDEQIAALESSIVDIQADLAATLDENETLTTVNQELERRLNEDAELLAIFTAPNWQTKLIAGTELNEAASGHLVVSPAQELAVLSVSNLEPLSAELTYQFWLIGDTVQSAGTFEIVPEGPSTYTFNLDDLSPYSAIGVSIEPLGGSDQPTGDIVMLTPSN